MGLISRMQMDPLKYGGHVIRPSQSKQVVKNIFQQSCYLLTGSSSKNPPAKSTGGQKGKSQNWCHLIKWNAGYSKLEMLEVF